LTLLLLTPGSNFGREAAQEEAGSLPPSAPAVSVALASS
jgi:hypothetical protein